MVPAAFASPAAGEPVAAAVRAGQFIAAVAQLPARIRHGRPPRLVIRAAVAALLCLAALAMIPGRSESDLAPPRQR